MPSVAFPRVDDHLVEAEITRDEIIGGHWIVVPYALEPHAAQQSRLNYVLRGHVVPGYQAASDLLTRFDQESDFAADACLYKGGMDPKTGARHLEELTFQIVSEKTEKWVTEKACRMHGRGVRRIFTVWVKTHQVCEWSPEVEDWRPLNADARIEDPCLLVPLPLAALFDHEAADNSVVEALYAKGNLRLLSLLAEASARGKARGRVEGTARAMLRVLERRGIPLDTEQRQEILDCHDLDRLDLWLDRAAVASSADEVMSKP